MDELKLTGNCGHGTRALLCFDATLDAEPHWRAVKDLLAVTFGVPRGHPSPSLHRCMAFAIDDGKVWVRHYQIVDDALTTPTPRCGRRPCQPQPGPGDDEPYFHAPVLNFRAAGARRPRRREPI